MYNVMLFVPCNLGSARTSWIGPGEWVNIKDLQAGLTHKGSGQSIVKRHTLKTNKTGPHQTWIILCLTAIVLALVTDKDYVDKRIHISKGDVREGDNVLLEKKKENKQAIAFL